MLAGASVAAEAMVVRGQVQQHIREYSERLFFANECVSEVELTGDVGRSGRKERSFLALRDRDEPGQSSCNSGILDPKYTEVAASRSCGHLVQYFITVIQSPAQ